MSDSSTDSDLEGKGENDNSLRESNEDSNKEKGNSVEEIDGDEMMVVDVESMDERNDKEEEKVKIRKPTQVRIEMPPEIQIVDDEEKVEEEFLHITPKTPLNPNSKQTFARNEFVADPIEEFSDEVSDDDDNDENRKKIDLEIPKNILIYITYFSGLVVDTYFLYNFWNLNIRIVRDTYYYSLASTGFNMLSLAAVFSFLFPIALALCLPSSCYCCSIRGYYVDFFLQSISWLFLSLSIIKNIECRLIFQCIFFICYCFKIMLMLGSPSKHHSIRYLRFKHANILSFIYISVLRWCFIGYVPIYYSGWISGLIVLFGVACLVYVFAEESLTIVFPKTWSRLNERCNDTSIHLPNEIYENFILPSKNFPGRVVGLIATSILRKRDLYKVHSELSASQMSLMSLLKHKRYKRRGDDDDIYCLLVYILEVVFGAIQLFSLLLFAIGFGGVLHFLTHFVLPPLSLPVWSGRQSYWDGLIPIFSLFCGLILSFVSRTYLDKLEFVTQIKAEEVSNRKKKKNALEEEEESNPSLLPNINAIRKSWKVNGSTMPNICCSPCIFMNFFLFFALFFGLISYAIDLNFVFWTGNFLIFLLPSLYEYFVDESNHFQFYLLTDLVDLGSYVVEYTCVLVHPKKSEYEQNHEKRLDVFRGPGLFFSCSYLPFVIILFSNIGVFSYYLFPVFGTIFGGRVYLVTIMTILFVYISMLSVLINRCVLLLRYRVVYASQEEFPLLSFLCVGFLFKSICFPRMVEWDVYHNILRQKYLPKKRKRRSRSDIDGLFPTRDFPDLDSLDMTAEMNDMNFQGSIDTKNNLREEREFEITTVEELTEEESDGITRIGSPRQHQEQQNMFEKSHNITKVVEDDDLEEGGEEMEDMVFQKRKIRFDIPPIQVQQQQQASEEIKIEEKMESEEYPGEVVYDEVDFEVESEEAEREDNESSEEEEELEDSETIQKVGNILTFIFSHVMCKSLKRFFFLSQLIMLIPAFLFLCIGLVSTPSPYDNETTYHSSFYRIASFNVFQGYTIDGMDNADQVVNDFLIGQEIDFCGMQETCTARPEVGYQDIIKYYGIMSKSPHYVQGKEARESTIGVGIVSRLPIGEVDEHLFTNSEDGLNRMYLHTTIEINDTVVHVVNVHLGLTEELQKEQSTQIIKFLEEEIEKDVPIIVLGDFNTDTSDVSITMFADYGFTDAYFEVNGKHDYTYKGKDEETGTAIDYVLVKGTQISIMNAYIYRCEDEGLERPSDHYPVVVDLIVNQK